MANEKTTIELETLNGNKVYPEIDASKLTGEIAESNTGFATGGDVYAALLNKADYSDIPYVPVYEDFNDDIRGRTPSYNYNCHTITDEDITNKQFILKLPLNRTNKACYIRLLGDIYGLRYIRNSKGQSIDSNCITSIEIVLGNSAGKPITDEPVIRKLDPSEMATSDTNVSTDTSIARFHFSHFGSASNAMRPITNNAEYLLIIVNIATPTETKGFKVGDIFEVLVNWVQF